METSWTKKIQRLLDIWTKLESFSWKEHDNYHGDYNKTYDGDACKQKTCDMMVMHGKNLWYDGDACKQKTCDMMVMHGKNLWYDGDACKQKTCDMTPENPIFPTWNWHSRCTIFA